MPIEIVPLQKGHIEEVIDILQLISKFNPPKSKYDKIWECYVDHRDNYGVVALDHFGKVVGYGSLLLNYKIRGGIMGHIEDIAVHKDFQNNGIGKLIINALYEIGKKNQCYKLSLSCKKENLNFYKKYNYFETGITVTNFLSK